MTGQKPETQGALFMGSLVLATPVRSAGYHSDEIAREATTSSPVHSVDQRLLRF